MRPLDIFFVTIAGTVLILTGSPSRAGCGGGGEKKAEGGEHHDRRGDHDEHGGVGVGFDVDLGGIGHRTREPDPFAVSERSSKTHTAKRERPKKKEHHSTASNPFADIKLTGKQAKDVAASDNSSATLPKN
jgi:hypothetical protein